MNWEIIKRRIAISLASQEAEILVNADNFGFYGAIYETI